MKAMLLTLTVLMSASMAVAGPKKAKVDDFNEMIQENQKSEAMLHNDLQKEAGIRLNQEKPGYIAKDKLQIESEPEQVAVNSSATFFKSKTVNGKKALEKADMKRISQELEDASSN